MVLICTENRMFFLPEPPIGAWHANVYHIVFTLQVGVRPRIVLHSKNYSGSKRKNNIYFHQKKKAQVLFIMHSADVDSTDEIGSF